VTGLEADELERLVQLAGFDEAHRQRFVIFAAVVGNQEELDRRVRREHGGLGIEHDLPRAAIGHYAGDDHHILVVRVLLLVGGEVLADLAEIARARVVRFDGLVVGNAKDLRRRRRRHGEDDQGSRHRGKARPKRGRVVLHDAPGVGSGTVAV